MRYKITDIDNESFYQLPKSLFTQKNYRGLSSDAKIIYAMLKDRMCLSRKNKWQDANGDIFLLFTQPDIGALLDLSASSVSRAMKNLQEKKLIDLVRQGLNRPNKIYINKVEVSSFESDFIHSLAEDEEDMKSAQYTTGDSADLPDLHICKSGLAPLQVKSCTTASQDLHIWDSRLAPVQASNTDINKTDKNKTNKNYTDNNNIGIDMHEQEDHQTEFVVVVDLLIKIGTTEHKAMDLIRHYGVEQVKNKLYLLSQQEKVSNAVGFIIQALREDYKDARIVAAEQKLFSRTKAQEENNRLREESLKCQDQEYQMTEQERMNLAISKANTFQGLFYAKYNLKFDHKLALVHDDRIRNILVDIFSTEQYIVQNTGKIISITADMLQKMVGEYFNTNYTNHQHELCHFLSDEVFS